MTQMNLSRNRSREQKCCCQGAGEVGEGWSGYLGLADGN